MITEHSSYDPPSEQYSLKRMSFPLRERVYNSLTDLLNVRNVQGKQNFKSSKCQTEKNYESQQHTEIFSISAVQQTRE